MAVINCLNVFDNETLLVGYHKIGPSFYVSRYRVSSNNEIDEQCQYHGHDSNIWQIE